MKTLEPLNDRVLIKPVEDNETMYGNIIVPDLGKERPEMGEVIAVGPGRTTEFGQYIVPNVQVGDMVLVPKIGTLRVEFNEEEYFIVPDKEILAVVKEIGE